MSPTAAIWWSTPATCASTSASALSVSTVATGSPACTVAPSGTSQPVIRPSSIESEAGQEQIAHAAPRARLRSTARTMSAAVG